MPGEGGVTEDPLTVREGPGEGPGDGSGESPGEGTGEVPGEDPGEGSGEGPIAFCDGVGDGVSESEHSTRRRREPSRRMLEMAERIPFASAGRRLNRAGRCPDHDARRPTRVRLALVRCSDRRARSDYPPLELFPPPPFEPVKNKRIKNRIRISLYLSSL